VCIKRCMHGSEEAAAQQCTAATRHMHTIAKGQMNDGGALGRSVAEQFYGLAT